MNPCTGGVMVGGVGGVGGTGQARGVVVGVAEDKSSLVIKA